MESKSVKVSWVLLLIVHCVVIILALMVLIIPKVSIANEFQVLTGHQWSDFMSSNPQVSSYISILTFEIGIFAVTIGISALFITLFAYREGEKWAWYLLLILYTIVWGGGIRANLYTGDMVSVVIGIVLLAIAYIGLAIAAKTILKKVSIKN
jgi:hypothetical protein